MGSGTGATTGSMGAGHNDVGGAAVRNQADDEAQGWRGRSAWPGRWQGEWAAGCGVARPRFKNS